METSTPMANPEVAAVFAEFAEPVRERLLELRVCISLALTYHKRKHLNLPGA